MSILLDWAELGLLRMRKKGTRPCSSSAVTDFNCGLTGEQSQKGDRSKAIAFWRDLQVIRGMRKVTTYGERAGEMQHLPCVSSDRSSLFAQVLHQSQQNMYSFRSPHHCTAAQSGVCLLYFESSILRSNRANAFESWSALIGGMTRLATGTQRLEVGDGGGLFPYCTFGACHVCVTSATGDQGHVPLATTSFEDHLYLEESAKLSPESFSSTDYRV